MVVAAMSIAEVRVESGRSCLVVAGVVLATQEDLCRDEKLPYMPDVEGDKEQGYWTRPMLHTVRDKINAAVLKERGIE